MIPAHELPAWTRLPSGLGGWATVYPDMDFETYSEAGRVWDETAQKWRHVVKSPPYGIGAVGASVYAEHPSTEVLSLGYNLKDGAGEKLWLPGMPPPQDLFDYLATGMPFEAWNSAFEYEIWHHVCVKKLGWPPIALEQTRDAMAKARAFGLPGKLALAGKALKADILKIDDGKRLIKKFSEPRNPTKKDDRLRLRPEEDPEDGPLLYGYNLGDIRTEADISSRIPDLSNHELAVWRMDQRINQRGVQVDLRGLDDCVAIVEGVREKYTARLRDITSGAVQSVDELANLQNWLVGTGIKLPNMQKDTIADFLKDRGDVVGHPGVEALKLRQKLAAKSVDKLASLKRRTSRDGRIRGLFAYCGADRTGRWAGRGPQPQNLPSSGPPVRRCDKINGCGHYYHASLEVCPWCGISCAFSEKADWGIGPVRDALMIMRRRDVDTLERFFVDALGTVGGCLRGLFMAAKGKRFMCSDYSAIEAVVLACLAGEEWRVDVFRTHGKIYEMSAAGISGIPFSEFMACAGYTDLGKPEWWKDKQTGSHHKLRKLLGKVAELASGYQGSVGAWKQFGADEYFDNDEDILQAVRAWRAKSPKIVDLWYGLERAAIAAIKYPGQRHEYRDISYQMEGGVLFCTLLSGRKLCYHSPRLVPDVTPWGKQVEKITYWGMNTDSKKGPVGWICMETYGGKLAENVTQATARDIMAHAMLNLDAAGYLPVLHVHDEVVCEVDEDFGAIEELERIMADVPAWCRDWPIKAAGGWIDNRYQKD